MLITDDMRRTIGTATAPRTIEIEKGAIRRFAEAIGDTNPLYQDETAARRSRFGGIIASPTFLRSIQIDRPELPLKNPLERLLDAGSEWEYFQPVRPGDRITVVTRLVDLVERTSRTIGEMLMTTYESIYTNQLNQVVATQRATFIRY